MWILTDLSDRIMDVMKTVSGTRGFVLFLMALVLAASCGNSQEGEAEQGHRRQFSPQQNVVEVMVLEETEFRRQLISNGRLAASSRGALNFRTSGVVKSVRCEEGQTVHEGDTIAVLYSEDKRYALESAELAFRKAELDLYNELAGYGFSVRDTSSVPSDMMAVARLRSGYDAAENSMKRARYDLDGCILTAPFSGKVADLKIRPYTQTPSEAACIIVDDSRMTVRFPILESEYPFIGKGLRVWVYPYADRGLAAEGMVRTVNPTVDANGQLMVTASVDRTDALLDGMNVKVIVERTEGNRLVVPKSAVVIRDNENVLFRYKAGKSQWTYVHVLESNSESHAVIANTARGAELSAGDTVIVSGNLNIADGSDVILKN